jgi:uncharacterized protein
MTPQEQQLVADLFDRLASLENQRRDPDAERLIREGLGRAPNSVYALVQSVLVQDEALKRANARIEELERAAAAPAESGSGGGFLDSMRSAILGRDQPRASVPSVRPSGMGSSGVWGSGPGAGQPQANPQAYPQGYPQGSPQGGYPTGAPVGGGGSSFLGTAAATVAGVVGGGMLLDGIRSMMGGHHSFAGDTGGVAHAAASPWDSGSDRGGGNLARDAGLDDISGGHRAAAHDDSSRSGFLSDDDAGNEPDDQPDDDFDAGDMGDSGDYDTA